MKYVLKSSRLHLFRVDVLKGMLAAHAEPDIVADAH
jgi:hypothetical protein